MSQATYHPLEEILRLIARNSPHPWYPRQFLRESGADPDQVSALLEHLSMEGLIERAPGRSLEAGSGVVLTELGHEVVRDTVLLDKLIRGEPLRPNDPGAIIRNDLRNASPPYVTYGLIAVNVLIFFYARPDNSASIDGMAAAGNIRDGQWWRLLTSIFLHAGLMHLGCNMFSLYSVGSFVEQTWGRWRYLAIYFISGWGGSCLAMAMQPEDPVVGASGAICGVLGAIGMWFVIYRRHLRPEAARSGLWQVGTSIALTALIGFMVPRVSNWGHLGGGIAGALATVILHVQRFGLPGGGLKSPAFRWSFAALLLVLPVASYLQMQKAWARAPYLFWVNPERKFFWVDREGELFRRARDGTMIPVDPDGKQRDADPDDRIDKGPKKGGKKRSKDPEPAGVAGPFLRHYAEPISEEVDGVLKACGRISLDPEKAKGDERNKSTLARLAKQRTKLAELQGELREKRYGDEQVEVARTDALKLVAETLSLSDMATAYLKSPDADGKEKVKSQFAVVDDLLASLERSRKALRDR